MFFQKWLLILPVILVAFGLSGCEKQEALEQGAKEGLKQKEELNVGDHRNSVDNKKEVETELWNQLIKNPDNAKYVRDYFSIEAVNDDKTVAVGEYRNGSMPGGANVFAFRLETDGEWEIKITQEAILCADIDQFTSSQVEFIKNNYVDYCAEFDNEGNMSKRPL